MSKAIPYLIITVLCFVIIFLIKGCYKDVASIQQLQDSLSAQIRVNDTIKQQRVVLVAKFDSTSHKNTEDSLSFTHKIDSLQKAYNTLKGRWSATKDSIFELKQQLDLFANSSDNERLKEIVGQLDGQLTDANNQLFAISLNRDSTDEAKDNEIIRLRGVIVDLQNQLEELNKLLIQATDNASNIAKTANKTINKLKAKNLLSKISVGLNAILAVLLFVK